MVLWINFKTCFLFYKSLIYLYFFIACFYLHMGMLHWYILLLLLLLFYCLSLLYIAFNTLHCCIVFHWFYYIMVFYCFTSLSIVFITLNCFCFSFYRRIMARLCSQRPINSTLNRSYYLQVHGHLFLQCVLLRYLRHHNSF